MAGMLLSGALVLSLAYLAYNAVKKKKQQKNSSKPKSAATPQNTTGIATAAAANGPATSVVGGDEKTMTAQLSRGGGGGGSNAKSSANLFYHFTTPNALPLILQSNKLLESMRSRGDAVYGAGVYFTKLSPLLHSLKTIYVNNWQALWNTNAEQEMAVALEIEYTGDNMTEVGRNDHRDVWLFEDFHLTNLRKFLRRIIVNAKFITQTVVDKLTANGFHVLVVENVNGYLKASS